MFFINSIKNPTSSFNIHHFISFSTSARSGGFKLHHNPSTTNKQQHFYFVRICRLWNALPLIDVNLSIDTIRNRAKSHFWNHFIHNFDPLNPHTLHYHFPVVGVLLIISRLTTHCFRQFIMCSFIIICDRISHNKASTHTKSNLRFYQKWIAGLIHYHISHCTSFSTGKSGFCSSFLPTLSKPRV